MKKDRMSSAAVVMGTLWVNYFLVCMYGTWGFHVFIEYLRMKAAGETEKLLTSVRNVRTNVRKKVKNWRRKVLPERNGIFLQIHGKSFPE